LGANLALALNNSATGRISAAWSARLRGSREGASDTRNGCRRHFRRAVRRLLTAVRSSRRGFNCPRRRDVHVRRQRACDTGPNPDLRV